MDPYSFMFDQPDPAAAEAALRARFLRGQPAPRIGPTPEELAAQQAMQQPRAAPPAGRPLAQTLASRSPPQQPGYDSLDETRARRDKLAEQQGQYEADAYKPINPAEYEAQGQQRQRAGSENMLLGLAAGEAGLAPMSAMHLKQAAEYRAPKKVTGGEIDSEGKFQRDPGYAAELLAKRAESLGRTVAQMDATILTAEGRKERDRIDQQRWEADRQSKEMIARAIHGMGGGGFGGAAIGTDTTGQPVFQNSKTGVLTHHVNGVPTQYTGPVNSKASGGVPSEDERKAESWAQQAGNAIKNMNAAVLADPSASMPTLKESASGYIPGKFGQDVQNSTRSETRQQFMQAASSMSEALLRAATGAGVNNSEAEQKIRELVPQIGDKPGVIKQKQDSYQVYMGALQARAGRAHVPGAAPKRQRFNPATGELE